MCALHPFVARSCHHILLLDMKSVHVPGNPVAAIKDYDRGSVGPPPEPRIPLLQGSDDDIHQSDRHHAENGINQRAVITHDRLYRDTAKQENDDQLDGCEGR